MHAPLGRTHEGARNGQLARATELGEQLFQRLKSATECYTEPQQERDIKRFAAEVNRAIKEHWNGRVNGDAFAMHDLAETLINILNKFSIWEEVQRNKAARRPRGDSLSELCEEFADLAKNPTSSGEQIIPNNQTGQG
jgi:hypothetical protein